jgi:hypothetical protein
VMPVECERDSWHGPRVLGATSVGHAVYGELVSVEVCHNSGPWRRQIEILFL